MVRAPSGPDGKDTHPDWLRRLSLGHLGDVKPVGEGVSELRIDYGAGYRVYFIQRGKTLVVLLAGGDKRTQPRDIQKAITLSKTV